MEPMISPPSELGREGACPPEGEDCVTASRCDTASYARQATRAVLKSSLGRGWLVAKPGHV